MAGSQRVGGIISASLQTSIGLRRRQFSSQHWGGRVFTLPLQALDNEKNRCGRMSFKNSHFVAGFSEGEDDDALSHASVLHEEVATGMTVDDAEVNRVLSSCLKGIAKPRGPRPRDENAPSAKRVKTPAPSTAVRASDMQTLSGNGSRAVSPQPDGSSSGSATLKETELDKQLRIRAERFGMYSITQQAVQARAFSTTSGPKSNVSETLHSNGAVTEQSSSMPHLSTISPPEVRVSDSVQVTGSVADSATRRPENAISSSRPSLTETSVAPQPRHIPYSTERFPPLPVSIMSRLTGVLRRGNFSCRITDDLRQAAEPILGRFAPEVSLEAMRSMRHTLLADRAMMVHNQLNQRDIAERYEKGQSLESISKEYSAPAFACLRLVLKARGDSPKFIKDAIAGRVDMRTTRDSQERARASEIDSTTAELDDRLGASLQFEESVGAYLLGKGIKFKTQNDMKGHALTPDFLIDPSTPLVLGTHAIRWIDAKNFFGGVSKNHIAKLKKQAHKYTNAMGPGALLFSMGFCDELVSKMEDDRVVVLDFRWFVPDYVAVGDIDRSAPPLNNASSTPSVSVPMGISSSSQSEQTSSSTKRASSDAAQSHSTKRLRFATMAESWKHVFATIEKLGFTGVVDESVVQETNETLQATDPEFEPFKVEHVERIHHDLMCDLRQEIEKNKDVRSKEVQQRHLARFTSGDSALAIATSDILPPLLVMRNILEARGASAKDIDRVCKPNITVGSLNSMLVREKILREREVEDLAQIVEQDLFFYPVEETAFERTVINFLRNVQVAVELKEQPWRHLLVKSELTIEGENVKWILTSDHLGGASKRLVARYKSIALTLASTIGPGAIVFAHGFVDPQLIGPTPKRVVSVDFRLLALA